MIFCLTQWKLGLLLCNFCEDVLALLPDSFCISDYLQFDETKKTLRLSLGNGLEGTQSQNAPHVMVGKRECVADGSSTMVPTYYLLAAYCYCTITQA